MLKENNMTKSYERIKNFSTTIAVEKTIAEIERMLSKYGVTKIMKEFDEFGNTSELPPIEMSGFKVKSQLGVPTIHDGLNP